MHVFLSFQNYTVLYARFVLALRTMERKDVDLPRVPLRYRKRIKNTKRSIVLSARTNLAYNTV